MNRKGGARRRTRGKLTKHADKKGKINIRGYLQSFNIGDRVQLMADSSVQNGLYYLRFYGRQGIITKKQGRAYYIEIKDGSVTKELIALPIHLKKLD